MYSTAAQTWCGCCPSVIVPQEPSSLLVRGSSAHTQQYELIQAGVRLVCIPFFLFPRLSPSLHPSLPPSFLLPSLLSLPPRPSPPTPCPGVTAASIAYLISGTQFTEFISPLQSVASQPVLWTSAKFLMALPLSYHMVNGIRHLVRDLHKRSSVFQ